MQGREGHQDAAQRPCVNPPSDNSAQEARIGSVRATRTAYAPAHSTPQIHTFSHPTSQGADNSDRGK